MTQHASTKPLVTRDRVLQRLEEDLQSGTSRSSTAEGDPSRRRRLTQSCGVGALAPVPQSIFRPVDLEYESPQCTGLLQNLGVLGLAEGAEAVGEESSGSSDSDTAGRILDKTLQ